MQVFYLPIIPELVLDCLLVSFLVYVGDYDDPAFDGSHSGGFGVRLHFGFVAGRGRRLIDFHFRVGHDEQISVSRQLESKKGEIGFNLQCLGRSDALGAGGIVRGA